MSKRWMRIGFTLAALLAVAPAPSHSDETRGEENTAPKNPGTELKKAGREVGHAARDGGKAIGRGARTAGKGIARGTKTAGKGIAAGARQIGHGFRDAVKKGQ